MTKAAKAPLIAPDTIHNAGGSDVWHAAVAPRTVSALTAPGVSAASPHGTPPGPSMAAALANPPHLGNNVGAPLVVTIVGNEGANPGRASALVSCRALLRRGALDDAKAALDQLRMDFQDADARLAGERLRLAEGWRQLDVP